MLVDKQRAEAYLPEQRYPLPLSSAMPDVWELWQRAKTLEWDPQTDIPWEDLHPERYSAEQLLAAQMYWSRRTWGEYGAISESPALLLRFCLERRLPDLQFFFTMRTMEEGRHAEASWLMAERLGRYFPQPQNPPTAGAVGTHGVRRMAFDPETSLEGIFASLVCAAEEILIDVFKSTVHKATNQAVRRLMELILRDEVRHIAFGWQCLDAWSSAATATSGSRSRAAAPRRPRSTPTASPARRAWEATRRKTRCGCSPSSSPRFASGWRRGASTCRCSSTLGWVRCSAHR